jgi:hypothetical protein
MHNPDSFPAIPERVSLTLAITGMQDATVH